MLGVMHLLTRRAFAVGVRVAAAGPAGRGDGRDGGRRRPAAAHPRCGRLPQPRAVLAAIPAVLLGTGFAHRQELEQARLLLTAAARSSARDLPSAAP